MRETLETRPTRAAIFVDVEYFRIACSGAGYNQHLLKNTQSMIERIKQICKDVEGVSKIDRWRCYAYDAIYEGKARSIIGVNGQKERNQIHQWMKVGGYTSRLGRFSLRTPDDNGKGVIVQKEVDTWLVVDAMREAWQVGTDTFIFITGDCDFVPLIKELKSYKHKTIVVHGSARSINERLKSAADHAVSI